MAPPFNPFPWPVFSSANKEIMAKFPPPPHPANSVADPDPDPNRIRMFLDFLDPDPDSLVRGIDPDPDPSIIMQK